MSYRCLPYSPEAYSNCYTEAFLTGFTHRSLASGKCDTKQSKEVIKQLNETAGRSMSPISFNEEMLTSDQLDGGSCSAIAFRIAKETLNLRARLQASGFSPADQEKSFAIQFMRIVSSLEAIATSQKESNKKIQTTIRSEQLALNTITVNRDKIHSGNAVSEKIAAMAPFYSMRVADSGAELQVKDNTMLEEELTKLMGDLRDGVYFLRVIQEKYNHKLEEKGHSIVYVKNTQGEYCFDSALGSYALFSGIAKANLIFNALLSANERFGVDVLSFHRLEIEDPIIEVPFSIKDPTLYGAIYYPRGEYLYPIVIFSPALGNTTHAYQELVEGLCRKGIVVISVNFPRTGMGTPRLAEEEIIERALENGSTLEKLITLIDEGHFANLSSDNPIGLMGHSLGGSSSIEACRKTLRIQAAMNLDGRIIDPSGVSQPVLQLVATKVKEDRTKYNEALQMLIHENAKAEKIELEISHQEFVSPKILDISERFFKEHLQGGQ